MGHETRRTGGHEEAGRDLGGVPHGGFPRVRIITITVWIIIKTKGVIFQEIAHGMKGRRFK